MQVMPTNANIETQKQQLMLAPFQMSHQYLNYEQGNRDLQMEDAESLVLPEQQFHGLFKIDELIKD
jgi:hypothetical protein